MREDPSPERPLEEWERDEFAAIVSGFTRTAGRRARRVRARPPAPVSLRQVVAVLGVASVLAVLCFLLPSPLNLWAPVVLLAGIAAVSLLWGLLRVERRTSG